MKAEKFEIFIRKLKSNYNQLIQYPLLPRILVVLLHFEYGIMGTK